jgi:hypothetical protein
MAHEGVKKRRSKKMPFFERANASGGGKRLDLRGQATLVAGGLVFVDDFLVGNAVDDRHGLGKHVPGSGFVAARDSLAHTLDGGAQGGTQTDVVGALLDRLTDALSGLCAIGHEKILNVWERQRFYRLRARTASKDCALGAIQTDVAFRSMNRRNPTPCFLPRHSPDSRAAGAENGASYESGLPRRCASENDGTGFSGT